MDKIFRTDASCVSEEAIFVRRTLTEGTTPNALAMRSHRLGSQAYFWTRDWQREEFLADIDYLIGGEHVYQPRGAGDLARWLDED